MRGVRIEDMGHKMGCNGVDNGKLWFDGTATPCHCAHTFNRSELLGMQMHHALTCSGSW